MPAAAYFSITMPWQKPEDEKGAVSSSGILIGLYPVSASICFLTQKNLYPTSKVVLEAFILSTPGL
jgi:hypothetical protein